MKHLCDSCLNFNKSLQACKEEKSVFTARLGGSCPFTHAVGALADSELEVSDFGMLHANLTLLTLSNSPKLAESLMALELLTRSCGILI